MLPKSKVRRTAEKLQTESYTIAFCVYVCATVLQLRKKFYGHFSKCLLLVLNLVLCRVEFSALAAEHKAVNVGQGFPDFSPPDHVKNAFKNVVDDHHIIHQYTRGFVSY